VQRDARNHAKGDRDSQAEQGVDGRARGDDSRAGSSRAADGAARAGRLTLDDPERVGPLVMSEATLAYRRLLERFGKRTEKLGHLQHTGEIRSSVGDDGIRTVELSCECGTLLGPWRDI
jgi:hypothetical protein